MVADFAQWELASQVARDFYAGRYGEVLAATVDSPRGGSDPSDRGFVVGALSFAGRLDEAELFLEATERRPGENFGQVLAVAAFALSVAHARSGDFARARAVLRRAVTRTSTARDAYARALLLQGAACCRFFAADYRGAARTARRALASAIAGEFAYGQLLANDLNGHVLFRLGRFHEGFATLARAEHQAKQLGLSSNVRAISTSIALQRAALAPVRDAIAQLREALAGGATEDSYSRRSILLELVVALAWSGHASEARSALDEAATLSAGDPRASCALACARAQLLRVEQGWRGAAPAIEDARRHLGERPEASREVEVIALELGLARHIGDEVGAARSLERLARIARDSGLHRAHACASHHGFGPVPPPSDDGAVAHGPFGARDVLAAGVLGLLAEVTHLEPGVRLHHFDDALVVERHGDVEAAPPISPRMRDLLEVLANGAADKPTLLARVWRIRRYRPEQHDSVVKTTISRLRASLAIRGDFVVTRDGHYALADGVEWINHARPGAPDDLAPAVHHTMEETAAANAALARKVQRRRLLLGALSSLGEASVSELARELRTSLRTVSRDVSELHEAHLVRRAGAGRSTRYRATTSLPDGGPT